MLFTMINKNINDRRKFLKNAGLLVGSLAMNKSWIKEVHAVTEDKNGEGTIFLFQGDSITDGGRSRNNDWNHVLGHGYAYLIASRLWADHTKQEFHFFNRGISGNTITDLTGRWEKDTLSIKPEVLSILIGINDISTYINGNKEYSVENFEKDYRTLLQDTQEELPRVQLVLCDPFILPVGKVKDRWNEYFPEIEKRQKAIAALAIEFKAIHIQFQKVFNSALSKAPAEYWIWDGVHPMPAGHELMAREWIHQVGKIVKSIR
jgi:lysophospholipase L1-like esterase